MKKQNAANVSENDIVFDGKYWIDKNGVRHRYVDPMSDEGFKVLFGSDMNRNDMLNSIAEQLEDARAEARAEAREIGLAEGREEGWAEGREEGRAEGREEGHVEERAKNAKNLRDLGVDPEIIAKATGLTVEEIRNL